MSNLYAFLNPETPGQKEVVFNRFKDEDGKAVPFIIRPITSEENNALIKKCTLTTKDRGGVKKNLNAEAYKSELIIAGCVQPDFTDAQLCEGYGVVDPKLVVGKMLLAGEAMDLVNEILTLSGLDDKSADEMEEEAKN